MKRTLWSLSRGINIIFSRDISKSKQYPFFITEITTIISNVSKETPSVMFYPIPEEAPERIPRLELSTLKTKISFSYDSCRIKGNFDTGLGRRYVDLFSHFMIDKANFSIKRLGLLKETFKSQPHSDLLGIFNSDYFETGILDKKCQTIEVTYAYQYLLTDNIICNNTQKVQTAHLPQPTSEDANNQIEGVSINREVNTASENERCFSTEELLACYDDFAVKLEDNVFNTRVRG